VVGDPGGRGGHASDHPLCLAPLAEGGIMPFAPHFRWVVELTF
jgi:hypothetical protein